MFTQTQLEQLTTDIASVIQRKAGGQEILITRVEQDGINTFILRHRSGKTYRVRIEEEV